MNLPSKELVSAVLGEEVKSVELWKENSIRYFAPKDYIINIYELAHKCKEWSKDEVYYLESGYINGAVCRVYLDLEDMKIFWADTEPEAVFKACEWILKEQNEK